MIYLSIACPFLRLLILMNLVYSPMFDADITAWSVRLSTSIAAKNKRKRMAERRNDRKVNMIVSLVENCLLIVSKLEPGILSNRDLLLNKMCLSPENHTYSVLFLSLSHSVYVFVSHT